jgi:hypothetical protein
VGDTVVPALAATVDVELDCWPANRGGEGSSRPIAAVKAAMERGQRRIKRLDLKRSVASQDLDAEVLTVATQTLEDIDGWARLFRLRPVAPG